MNHALIEKLLARQYGLDPATLGPRAVDDAVRIRMAARAVLDAQAYMELVNQEPFEAQALIEQLVIPETWFFRYPVSFEHMISFLVHTWFPANFTSTPRILSVPCSTGEEPYSIAMAMITAGIPSKKVRIDAIDVSRPALQIASQGVYGRHSFRGADLTYRDRYFEPLGEAYRIGAEAKDRVSFVTDNLLAPGFTDRQGVYDIVFCRNLMIYFDDASRKQAAAVLSRVLKPDGILYVGHSENLPMSENGFPLVEWPHAFACGHPNTSASTGVSWSSLTKRNSAGSSTIRQALSDHSSVSRRPIAPIRSRIRTSDSSVGSRTPKSTPSSTGKPAAVAPASSSVSGTSGANSSKSKSPHSRPTLDDVRVLADQGYVDKAVAVCEKILKDPGPSADGLCMLGILHQAANRINLAEEAYNKALYLDHQHYDALLHLSLLYEKMGEERLADNLMRRAQRAGERKPQ